LTDAPTPIWDLRLNDKTVLISGAGRGIGRACAVAFAQAGANVIAVARTEDDLQSLSKEYPKNIEAWVNDVTENAFYERIEELEKLDVLINNAGANLPGGRNEWEPDVFEEVVGINLFGSFRMAVACKDKLAKSRLDGGGNIVNLASMSAYFAVPVVPGYGAAKAGVVQMTKNLAVTWVGEGIRVNAVAPGLILSNMTAAMKGIEALEKPQIGRTPMGRWGTPEDIAPAILFLASPAARFVTGQTLPVDGGFSVA